MSFSASTCITVGASGLGPTLKLYSNPISSTNFGTFLQTVSKTDITGSNCPYTFLVPDGTTIVRVYDQSTYCYVDFTVSSSEKCESCNLSFNNVSNNLIGTINVGNLTGTCDPSITDYKISWYGPNSSTNVAFTSGKGTVFPGYSAPHPLTGSSAPFVLPGTYVSRITDVELNGVKFSVTGGTGTGSVLSSGLTACSATFNVSAFTCNNGTYSGPYYEHEKEFITDGSGTIPQSLQTAFRLSANTECFIWQFFGYNIYDTLKLTFSGSSYSEPLVLEEIQVGNDAPNSNYTPTTFPKTRRTQSYKKITNLSGLTINEGDLIIIQITPNTEENATSWMLRFGCYGQPTAEKNCLDSYKDQSYKIKKDSISVSTPSCGSFNITLDYSGCSTNDNSGFTESDLINLSNNEFGYSQISTDNTTKLVNNTFYFNTGTTGLTYDGVYYDTNCTYTSGNIIKITKTVGQIDFFFSNINDLAGYYNNFNTMKTAITNYIPPGGTILSNDNTTLNYYRRIWLIYPKAGTQSNAVCDTPGLDWDTGYIYPTATASSATTSAGYTMTITLPTITDGYTCPSCYYSCGYTSNFESDINTFSNLTFSERTYNNGLRYTKPFYYGASIYVYTSTSTLSYERSGYWYYRYDYGLNTYPASGVTNTLIPSLSSTTWDFQNHSFTTYGYGATGFEQIVYNTRIEITSTSPTITYKIYSKQISNFNITGSWIEIYDSTNPTGFDSNYMY